MNLAYVILFLIVTSTGQPQITVYTGTGHEAVEYGTREVCEAALPAALEHVKRTNPTVTFEASKCQEVPTSKDHV